MDEHSTPLSGSSNTPRMHSFGVIWIRITDASSLRLWYFQETSESTMITESSASLIQRDPSDLGSLILTQITLKERTIHISCYKS